MASGNEIAFLFIGGAHQVFHLAPVAAELSRKLPQTTVTCIYPDDETGTALQEVKAIYNAQSMVLDHVPPPRWGEALARLARHRSLRKGPLLLRLAARLRKAKAVVTPERTSAVLRLMGLSRTLFIHFRHGAGDRAPRSEKRLKAFDLIVEPGIKDIRRAIAVQHIDPARLRSCGYVKLDFIARRGPSPTRLFDNDRPVVVYNPHFDPHLSSWPAARAVIEEFRAQQGYNLIVAPHIRLSDDMDPAELAAWRKLEEPGRIIVDLRSSRLLDMTYTMAADIYLGDVSSQLYEFLVRPRPAVFFNTHQVCWENDRRYAGWKLGQVVESVDAIIPAIDRARARHPAIIERQLAAIEEAYGAYLGASERAAQILVQALSDAEKPPWPQTNAARFDAAGGSALRHLIRRAASGFRQTVLAKPASSIIDNDSQ